MPRTIARPAAPRDPLADYALLATCRIEPVQSPPLPAADQVSAADGQASGTPHGRPNMTGRTRRRRRASYIYTYRLVGRR